MERWTVVARRGIVYAGAMFTIYRVNADELDEHFLESIKAAFRHKQVEIAVSEADETDYLLRSQANREQLLRAVEDVKENRNIVVPDQQAFQ
jgi:antitoxin YefM